ncbi:2-methylcitrate dehydratase PrpD [Paraburkholderia sp. BL6669N2]|uniref:MmgE/PrpD family protein n=1 Tax=Paraburkholderia sp. BL6669N2 TaxID=1938807 RepID=UPI000E26CB5C|nr:MmgE/PrpD family protein [Paraburkholderia sp. BL6669N2]REG50989.1 2-methylcitrate dehydratase PrpD [Paraburkholderia sp. BL6669N2]
MSDFTHNLANRVTALHFDALEPETVRLIKLGIADCIGVTLAARGEEVVRIASATFATMEGRLHEATTLVSGRRVSSVQAALLNATAAHALDYDDTALDGHPSVVLLPASLAEGERLGASGRDVLTAYAAGYEVWARLRIVEADKIHSKGWHPSSTIGAVAAAAAAARVAGLSMTMTARALSIAASMAAGVVANFGSMMKPLQVGLAVSNGVRAARLAAAGLTASSGALEHPVGLLHALSPRGNLEFGASHDHINERSSAVLQFGINIKRYPVCYAMHRIVDAMAQVCADASIDPSQIARIDAHIGVAQAAMLRDSIPEDALSAKFSLSFGLACVAERGHITLDDLGGERIDDPALRSLMQRVRVVTNHERDPEDPLFSPADWVVIVLKDGTRVTSEPVKHAIGHARRPMIMALLEQKFHECASRTIMDSRKRTTLFEHLTRMETIECLDDLMAAFAAQ